MLLEELLLLLLFLYIMLSLLFGFTKGKKYLSETPKIGQEYIASIFHTHDVVLTLAGFSMTALALFISLQYESIREIASILLFLSISFSLLTLSVILTRFMMKRIYPYVSDVLADTGLLGFACGFLVFFWKMFQWSEGLAIIYIAFITVFILLSLLNFYKYYRYWSLIDERRKVETSE